MDENKTLPDNNPQPKEDTDGSYSLPQPGTAMKDSSRIGTAAAAPRRRTAPWRNIGIILFSFIASFLGAWVFLASGIVKPPQSTSVQTQQKLVLAEGDIISNVAQQVSPSVVSILVESSQLNLFNQSSSSQAAGTGIIISQNGYILTNKHVIPENVTDVQVVASDGTRYDNVKVVGRDPLNDIAFLQLNNVKNLKAAKLADSSQAVVGQRVVAVGNALGEFQTTVTSGIISGLNRSLVAGGEDGQNTSSLSDLLQTDAAINPGNSGGPLVNLNGEVIGINTAVANQAQGIGFAIPINAAKGLIKTVTEQGRLARAYIGVQYTTITPDIAKQQNLPVSSGALVGGGEGQSAVVSGSPAEKAGLKSGDVIIKVDGTDINRTNSLALLLSQKVPGDSVTLTYLRDGQPKTVRITLDELKT